MTTVRSSSSTATKQAVASVTTVRLDSSVTIQRTDSLNVATRYLRYILTMARNILVRSIKVRFSIINPVPPQLLVSGEIPNGHGVSYYHEDPLAIQYEGNLSLSLYLRSLKPFNPLRRLASWQTNRDREVLLPERSCQVPRKPDGQPGGGPGQLLLREREPHV